MRNALLWLGIVVMITLPPAAADTLRLGNCKFQSFHVETYEYWDTVCVYPKGEKTIGGCEGASFTCTGPCKVRVHDARGGFHCFSARHESGSRLVGRSGELHDPPYVFSLVPDNYDTYCDCGRTRMQTILGE